MSNNRIIPNDLLLSEVCTRLSEGNRVKLRPKGSSMYPCIRDGQDIVILAPILSLKLGHIVLAKVDESRYVLHRLVGFERNEVILMGDANLKEEERCSVGDVYGIAVSLLRNGRQICLTTTSPRIKGLIRHELRPIRQLIRKLTSKLNIHQK